MLIRDEYDALTSYLFLLLINRLLRGERSIFQSASGSVYEITNIVSQSKEPRSEGSEISCSHRCRRESAFSDIESL